MSRPLSWGAQRRGEIYCAPACGANCTYKVETRTIVDGFETVLIGLKGVKRRAKLRLYQGRPSSKRSLKG